MYYLCLFGCLLAAAVALPSHGLSHWAVHGGHRRARWAYQNACVDPSPQGPQSTSVAMFGGMLRGAGATGGGVGMAGGNVGVASPTVGGAGNPLFDRHNDIMPQGAMSAVITRDTVTSNAFANGDAGLDGLAGGVGDQFGGGADDVGAGGEKPGLGGSGLAGTQGDLSAANGVPDLSGDKEVASLAEESSEIDAPSRLPAGLDRVPKKKKPISHSSSSEEDDDSQNDAFPFNLGGRKGVPTYNAFFPIHINGGGGARSRHRNRATGGESEDEEAAPSAGSATAIANSFSTGRGGVASSHATSFGDPYLAALLAKNGLFNFRSKPGKSEA